MNFTKENIELIEKFIIIKNQGRYASGQEVTKVYNEVFDKNIPTSNCSSCIRTRITELENALRNFKKLSEQAQEAVKTEEVDNVSTKDEKEPSAKPKRGRKAKEDK